ncbi:MAG: hypothetical protein IID42_01955 [Planctomycetes bacterium]|nr:hypothetical protein [Planctomycetota bacterium]
MDAGRYSFHLSRTLSTAHESFEPIVVASIKGLAIHSPEQLVDLLTNQYLRKTRHLEYAIAKALPAAGDDFADAALTWLCQRPPRFRLGDGYAELHWAPAASLISRFSQHSSAAVFESLQVAILAYHDPYERKSLEDQLVRLTRGQSYPNDWGRAQNVLLDALPDDRMSTRAKLVAAEWKRKFGDPANEQPLNVHSTGGRVTSSIPPAKVHCVSDAGWLRIINGEFPDRHALRWRQHEPDVVGESSVSHFADALRTATMQNPTRFALLGLRIPCESDPAYFTALLAGLQQDGPNGGQAPIGSIGTSEIEAILEHVAIAVTPRISKPFVL